ncbi:MAG TPA: hypothetical protein VL475_00900, partial [Planctomycetaceae bacterium]|nr:hypothetical protein [Planctomycetaceae bacterium]
QRLGLLGPAWKIPEALMPADQLDDDPQNPRHLDEVRRFGPELIVGSGPSAKFITYQVYPLEER